MCEQARPSASVSFFSLLKQTRGAQLRGLPLWYGLRLGAPFLLRQKRAGGAPCGARRRNPLVSLQRNGVPALATIQLSGRPITLRVIGHASAGKKKDLKPRDELARTFGFQTLFRIACRSIYAHKNAGFRGSSREAFTLKAVPRSSPPPLENPAPLRYNKPNQTA